MLRTSIAALWFFIGGSSAWAADVSISAQHAMLVDEETGDVLLGKDPAVPVPIASLTKLITAMVVLDARQNADELIRIEVEDVDTLKHARSRLAVGVPLSRRALLELTLMASDNRAAAALVRTYPGGHEAYSNALGAKLRELGLESTYLEEPTGLSPNNRSSAADLVKIVRAACAYPEIAQYTTQRGNTIDIQGQLRRFQNTNRLIGGPGWDILLSKTGFTNEAGYCLVMRMRAADRQVILVLLGAGSNAQRMADAYTIRRWMAGDSTYASKLTTTAQREVRGAKETKRIKAKHVREPRAKTHLAQATPPSR